MRRSGCCGSRGPLLVVAAYVSELSVFLVLLVALRAVGVDSSQVSWSVVLASFSLVRILQSVPITPGRRRGSSSSASPAHWSPPVATTPPWSPGCCCSGRFTWLPPLLTGPFFYLGWKRWLRRNELDADFVPPDLKELRHEVEVIGEVCVRTDPRATHDRAQQSD